MRTSILRGLRNGSLTLAGALLIAGGAINQVNAHSFWINISDYEPISHAGHPGETKTYIGWGHHYPVDDFINRAQLAEYCLVDPVGRKSDIQAADNGFLAAQVPTGTGGYYWVTASLKPGFYTMYEDGGVIHHAVKPMTDLPNVILSLYYENYAKALVRSGDVTGYESQMTRPVGHTLEIIPLKDPFRIREGESLPVRVLFNGKPARYTQLTATYSGFSENDDCAFSTGTDGRGEASIRIIRRGVWLVKTKIKTPPDASMETKCREKSYAATLTFRVP